MYYSATFQNRFHRHLHAVYEYGSHEFSLLARMLSVANNDPDKGKWVTIKGEVNEKNKSDVILLNELLKPHRVECFRVATELLERIDVPYFVSDGTLLAIYREQGKIIPHDTDTDMAIMEEHMHTVWKNRHLLPEGYRWQTACPVTGVEWCDENGSKPFDPASKGTKKFKIIDTTDYSHYLENFAHNPFVTKQHVRVFTDIYTYRRADDDPSVVQINWARLDLGVEKKRFDYDKIFPRKKYVFEGVECWGPNDPEYWLTEFYGYIGRGAYFDPAEKIWKKLETESHNNNGER